MTDPNQDEDAEDAREALEEVLATTRTSSKFDPEKMWGKHHVCGSECKPECHMPLYKSAQAFAAGVPLPVESNPIPVAVSAAGVAIASVQTGVVGQAAASVEDPTDAADLMSLAYQLNLRQAKEIVSLKKRLAEAESKYLTLTTKLQEVRALIGSITP
jgi:hypothetical protein